MINCSLHFIVYILLISWKWLDIFLLSCNTLIKGSVGTCLQLYDLNLKHLLICSSKLLVKRDCCISSFFWHRIGWKLMLKDPLPNRVFQWLHLCDRMTFPGIKFWCVTSYIKYQLPQKLWSWSSDFTNLVEKEPNLQTKMFLKSNMIPMWWNYWSTSFINEYPQHEFNFMSCREICK